MNKTIERLNDKEINYQFTPIPTKLFYLCDNNTKSVLFSLIQLSSHYAKEDGYFFRANNNLENDCGLSRKVIDAALDALYMRDIIDVIPSAKGQGKKQSSKSFKVNFDSFLEYEKIDFNELKNPALRIVTPSTRNHYTPSFNKTLTQTSAQTSALVTNKGDIDSVTTLTQTLTQNANKGDIDSVTTLTQTSAQNANNINNIENIYNINNKNNINNNLNNIYNIENKKEINNLNNIENFENMNINEKIDLLIKRMESSNLEELENKRFKFIEWIKFNLTPTYQEEIEKRIEERYNEIYEKIVKSFNNGLNDDFFSSIELNSSTGKTIKEETEEILEVIPTKSKEKLIEMMEEVITTSTGNVEEADNFKMWVDLNKNEINSYDLMDKAEETFQFLRNKQKEAVSATLSTQVDSLPTSRVDAVKSPKNEQYKDVAVERTIEVNGRVLRLVDSEPDLDIIDTIWSEMQASAAS